MNDFEIAYKITAANEGGYCLEDGDTGGETYCGISRTNNPKWSGWAIVDKQKPLRKNQIINDATLIGLVKNYYKKMYWDTINGSQLPSQDIANQAYDQAVNGGVGSAKKLLKTIGITICMLLLCFTSISQPCPKIQRERDSLLLVTKSQAFRIERVRFYAKICNKKPSQRKFLLGWVNRAIN